jgi:hypothetical protein
MTVTRVLMPNDEIDADTLKVAVSYVQKICDKQTAPVEEVIRLPQGGAGWTLTLRRSTAAVQVGCVRPVKMG